MSWTNYTQLWSLGTYQPHSQPSLRIALLDLRSEPEQPVQDASEQPLERTDVVEAPEQPWRRTSPAETSASCTTPRTLYRTKRMGYLCVRRAPASTSSRPTLEASPEKMRSEISN